MCLTRFRGHLTIGGSRPEEGVHVPRSHSRSAPEFRAEAVRLVRAGGRTPRPLAADLGCSESSISRPTWVAQAGRGRCGPPQRWADQR
jgi:hypothetical protein